MSSSSSLVVVIAGSTGVGKSDVAARICKQRKGIVVSADSVQAYRGVHIGSNQPSIEEMAETPHLLVDFLNENINYNAAEWRKDALYAIDRLSASTDEPGMEEMGTDRTPFIEQAIQQARITKGYNDDTPLLPVVVGGTMMYLQWLVHGLPDAVRPSQVALDLASETIATYTRNDDFEGAVQHVVSYGPVYQQQVNKLSGRDWYRLRRILEVAITMQESSSPLPGDGSNQNVANAIYTGERQGGLKDLGYDVRCFFLCPHDRMAHTTVVDQRCEQMVQRGLVTETTDLAIAGRLPDMAAKAIGYRQTLDYLEREALMDNDEDAFHAYLNDFTAATRRYAKKQMQWFRKDEDFVFVPMDLSLEKAERVEIGAKEIERMLSLPREDYDHERLDPSGSSAKARAENEAQGKKMKFFQSKRHYLLPGSDELATAIQKADECTHHYQAENPKRCQDTLIR